MYETLLNEERKRLEEVRSVLLLSRQDSAQARLRSAPQLLTLTRGASIRSSKHPRVWFVARACE
jgi:hypothetical protein